MLSVVMVASIECCTVCVIPSLSVVAQLLLFGLLLWEQ